MVNYWGYIFYGWLVTASFLCIYWGFIIMLCREWIKPYLGAKVFKGSLEQQFMKDGSIVLSNTKRDMQTKSRWNKKKEPFQDFKEKETDQGSKITPQAWNCYGVRLFLRPEGSLTVLDKMFNPSPLSLTWLFDFIERQKIRVELGKKLIKKKSSDFPLIWIFGFILMIVVGYILYSIFWMGG